MPSAFSSAMWKGMANASDLIICDWFAVRFRKHLLVPLNHSPRSCWANAEQWQAAMPCAVCPDGNPHSCWEVGQWLSPVPYNLGPHTQNHCVTRGGFLCKFSKCCTASSQFELHWPQASLINFSHFPPLSELPSTYLCDTTKSNLSVHCGSSKTMFNTS